MTDAQAPAGPVDFLLTGIGQLVTCDPGEQEVDRGAHRAPGPATPGRSMPRSTATDRAWS